MYISSMMYDNIEYAEMYPEINWDDKQILLCEEIIKYLTEEEQLFIYQCYWAGLNQEELAEKLDYKSRQGMLYFRERLFAKIRFLIDLKYVVIPHCFSAFKKDNPAVYTLLKKILNFRNVNQVDSNARKFIRSFVQKLINFISLQETNCKNCKRQKECYMEIPNFKFIQHFSDNKALDNLLRLRKILSYCLSWRNYDEKH